MAKPSGRSFHFDFGVLIGAEYPPLLDTLKVVEQMTDETDTQDSRNVNASTRAHNSSSTLDGRRPIYI